MTVEALRQEIAQNVAGATVEIIVNPSPCAQHSLLVDNDHAVAVAMFLRDAPELQLDYCSNVTGIDWPAREMSEKFKVKKMVDGPDGPVEKDVDEVRKWTTPAYLEVVYHLFSMATGEGPVILRMRTGDREADIRVPSLTPVWRACEFQEREVFDLYGVVFTGHPDLRRLLMWEGFTDYPMRRDYVEPDDYEYEPTPHDEVLTRARAHTAAGMPPVEGQP
jgi:NADH-quinone oxidoreductase subunit C